MAEFFCEVGVFATFVIAIGFVLGIAFGMRWVYCGIKDNEESLDACRKRIRVLEEAAKAKE